ncbi:MAG TPA: hypothetical protein EYP10_11660 [Armatimonadetes bacterium]|nr:hypothetical protein [Armatimonadota bacterium]
MSHTLSRTLIRPVIALSLAVSLTFSPMAVKPAHANGDDAAKALGVIIALGVLGAVISSNERNAHGEHTPEVTQHQNLPASCLQTYDTWKGMRTMFGKRCLRDNYPFWRHLPSQCEKNIRFRNSRGQMRNGKAYRPACLQSQGYTIAYNY